MKNKYFSCQQGLGELLPDGVGIGSELFSADLMVQEDGMTGLSLRAGEFVSELRGLV